MKTLFATLLMASLLLPLAQAAPKQAPMTKPFKDTGTVVSFSDTSLVLSQGWIGKKHEISFVLNPETKRVGTLAKGEKVTVHYRMEGKDRVASLVQAPQTKALAQAKTKKSGY